MPTGQPLLGEYTAHLKALGRSPDTVRRVRTVVGGFEVSADLATATDADIEAWLASRRLCNRTRANYLALLSGFYKWAVRRGLVETNPVLTIDRPRLPSLLPRPMANADLACALEQATPRMRLWLCLAAYQGMRVAEIARLDSADIMISPPMLRVVGKGGKERLVPLAAETETALHCYGVPRRGPLFPNRQGWPLLAHTVSCYISRYLHSLDIDATGHQGRHWFGSSFYQATRDLRACQELLGHSSVATTQVYTAFAPAAETMSAVRDLTVRPYYRKRAVS